MTISERIAANARWLCQRQGKNIGDMEAAVGVSTGYLSRVKRAKGSVMLRIDVCYALAEYLSVSMDDLVNPKLARQERIAELKAELAELEQEEKDG